MRRLLAVLAARREELTNPAACRDIYRLVWTLVLTAAALRAAPLVNVIYRGCRSWFGGDLAFWRSSAVLVAGRRLQRPMDS